MSIQKYMAFLKTEEYKSFTKAAEVLGYTQSGISRMINDLEKQWGIELFERGAGGVHLTSDGIRLLPYVREVCSANDKLLTEMNEISGLESGIIRIGTFSSVATHWLPNMVKEFQKSHPNIVFEFLLGDYFEIEDWVLEGRVDCAFTRLPAKQGLDGLFIEDDPLMAVLPRNHPLAKAEKFPVEALGDYPFMLLEKGGKGDVSELFERHHIFPQVHFTMWDDYAVMAMVEGGFGIGVLPALILKRVPYDIVIKELDKPAFRKIGLVTNNKSPLTAAAKRFVSYMGYRNKQ